MNLNILFISVFIALAFVGWPIVGKYTKLSSGMMGSIVMLFTASTVILLSFFRRELSTELITNYKLVILLIIAGMINGVAVYLYSIKAVDQTITTSIFVVTVSVLMICLAPVLDLVINSTAISIRQIFGFIFAIVAIFLLVLK